MRNYIQIIIRTSHYGIHMNLRNSNCFLHTLEHLFAVKEFTWMRESKSDWSVLKLLLSPRVHGLLLSGDVPYTFYYIMFTSCFPLILGRSQPDNYFLCRLLTWYSEVKDFCSNDLSPLNEDFFEWTSLWVSWLSAKTRVCVLHWVVILMYTDGFQQPVTDS